MLKISRPKSVGDYFRRVNNTVIFLDKNVDEYELRQLTANPLYCIVSKNNKWSVKEVNKREGSSKPHDLEIEVRSDPELESYIAMTFW